MHYSRRKVMASLGALMTVPVLSGLTSASIGGLGPLRSREFLDAVRNGQLERVRSMLSRDKTLAGVTDDQGRSAFILAHLKGHVGVAQVLRDTGLELDIVEAVLAEDWKRFADLSDAHPELRNQAHAIGGTPLYAAGLVGSLGGWRLRSAGCLSDQAPRGGTGFTEVRGSMECERSSWARIGLVDACGNGSNINAPQRGGSSALHGAVKRRDGLLVRLAIRKGANVEAENAAGQTPLDLARAMNWEEGASLLKNQASLPRDNRSSRFARNADREPIQRPDLSKVPQALQNEVTGSSHGNLKRVRELISGNKDLVFSISTDDELAIEACAHVGNREIIRYHLDQGAPLSLPTAISLGDEATVLNLLEEDPTLIHERGAHDFPPMWYAVMGGGSVEMAQLLFEHGAAPDQESKGTTALHWCVRRGAKDLASWLIANGADPEAVAHNWSRDGQTPLQVASERGADEMGKLLKSLGARR